MNQQLLRLVWERAKNRCEYCRTPHPQYRLPFQIDHVIARQHGGPTVSENLALACFHCNRFEGPNIAGLDPDSGGLVRLFHPRTDSWAEHFSVDGPRIVGTTAIRRATVTWQFARRSRSDITRKWHVAMRLEWELVLNHQTPSGT